MAKYKIILHGKESTYFDFISELLNEIKRGFYTEIGTAANLIVDRPKSYNHFYAILKRDEIIYRGEKGRLFVKEGFTVSDQFIEYLIHERHLLIRKSQKHPKQLGAVLERLPKHTVMVQGEEKRVILMEDIVNYMSKTA